MYIYLFQRIMVGVTVSIELLLSNDTRCLILSFFVCVLFVSLLVLTL
jgi:hypothetical protein